MSTGRSVLLLRGVLTNIVQIMLDQPQRVMLPLHHSTRFMEEHIESLRLSRAGRSKKAAFGSFCHDRVFSIQLSDLNTMCVESSHVPMSSAVRVFRQITGPIFVRFLCYATLYLILLYIY